MNRVDAHQHFWSLARGDYHWLTPDITELYRDFLPADIRPLLKQAGVEKCVLVQAAPSVEETHYLLAIARQHPDIIAGVVGWVELESPAAVETLQELAKTPLFKGIRPMLQEIQDVDWILNPKFDDVFHTLISLDLTFDAIITPSQIKVISELLQRYPSLNLVVDHGANPDIAKGSIQEWRQHISQLASQTNAYCKVSGLLTRIGDCTKKDKLTPYLDTLYHEFGADRLMWGSDWPVVNLAGNYREWIIICDQWMSRLDDKEKERIWSLTAEKFYNL